MQIQGFDNPTVTLENVSTAILTQIPEERLKSMVFDALSIFQPKDLAKDLYENFLGKLEGYAQERAQKIDRTVRMLNGLCDQRAALLASCSSFKKAKEAFQNVSSVYENLFFLDSKMAMQVMQDISNLLSANKRKKLEFSVNDCCSQSSMHPLYDAWNALKEVSKDAETAKKQINALCSALKSVFLDSEKEDVNTTKARLLQYGRNKNPEALEILDQLLPIAKEQALEIRAKQLAEKGAKIEAAIASLKTILAVYHENKRDYRANRSYEAYAAQKKVVHQALSDIAAFCPLIEIVTHEKITNDAQNRMYKIVGMR